MFDTRNLSMEIRAEMAKAYRAEYGEPLPNLMGYNAGVKRRLDAEAVLKK